MQACIDRTGLSTGHSTVVDGITPHKSCFQKGEECSDRGDSSALSGQTFLCSGIVFGLESEVSGSNLIAGTDPVLHMYVCACMYACARARVCVCVCK